MDTDISELPPIIMPIIQPVFLPSSPSKECKPKIKPACSCKDGDPNCDCGCKCKCVSDFNIYFYVITFNRNLLVYVLEWISKKK